MVVRLFTGIDSDLKGSQPGGINVLYFNAVNYKLPPQ